MNGIAPSDRLAGILAVLVCAHFAFGQEDQQLTARFFREAPSAWEEYARRTARLQGTYTIRTALSPSKTTVEVDYEFKANDKCKSLREAYVSKQDEKKSTRSDAVYGLNRNYCFQLRRDGELNTPWVLVQIVDLQKNAIPEIFTRKFNDQATLLTQLIRLDQDLMAEVILQPAFRVLSCKSVRHDSAELVEVVFRYPHKPNEKPPYNSAQGGSLILDPQRLWSIRESKLTTENGFLNKQVEEQIDISNSFAVPKTMITEKTTIFGADQVQKGFPVKTSQEARWTLNVNAPTRLPDEEEFMLKAYGLPEPTWLDAPRTTRWHLWFGLTAILCVATGTIILKWRARSKLTQV